MSDKNQEKETKQPLSKKWKAFKLTFNWIYNSSKPITYFVILFSAIGGLINIIEPYVFKVIIDELVGTTKRTLAQSLGLGILGILVIYGFSKILQIIYWDTSSILKRMHSTKIEKYGTYKMLEKISSLDVEYFENPEYYNKLTKTAHHNWRVLDIFWMFTVFIYEFVATFVVLAALLAFSWKIVLLIVVAAIPSIYIALKASEVLWSAFDTTSPIYKEAYYYRWLLSENKEAIKEIRMFGLKTHFLEKFENLFTNFVKKQDKAAIKQFFSYIGIAIVEGCLSVYAAWIVVDFYIKGRISVGELTFLWAVLFQFAGHTRWFVRTISDLNTNLNFITPLVDIFALKNKIKSPENPKRFPVKLKKGIEFKNVTFTYPRAKKPSLKNINLVIRQGENVALVGENGSGKTTLIKLLTRLYDVDKGEILIDGVNIKEYSLDDLYERIGVIFQDFMKYEGLVKENIQYGNIKIVSKKKLHEAAVKAGAWEFIKELEEKYDTKVGTRIYDTGKELSIGQWQKIALARAFFKDADILILDEPTAAVDAKAEYEIFKRFEKLSKGKITVLISHRFSTVRMAHRVIVMDKGRIIEQGSHKELMKKKGKYAMLFSLQAQGYKEEKE